MSFFNYFFSHYSICKKLNLSYNFVDLSVIDSQNKYFFNNLNKLLPNLVYTSFYFYKNLTNKYFIYLSIFNKLNNIKKRCKNLCKINKSDNLICFNVNFINLYLSLKFFKKKSLNISYYYYFHLVQYLGNGLVNNTSIKFLFYRKLFKVVNGLLWFLFTFFNMKNLVYFTLKVLFLDLIFRNNFMYDKLSLFFYEVKDINILTSSLISNYIIRNLRIGHTLNRIIYPLMRHLSESQYIFYNGWKIGCFGRFQRRGRARKVWYGKIGVPLNTLIANIDYAKSIVRLRNGLCCIKVFITKTAVYHYYL